MKHTFKRGVYETTGGFEAFVAGPNAQYAFDLTCFGVIPISDVTPKWLREADKDDESTALPNLRHATPEMVAAE